jgi:N-acetylneuraminic acid mutarotase
MNFNKSLTPAKILLCGAFVLVGLLSLSSISLAQEPWTEKTPMPTARDVLSTSVVDGKIYAIGGTKGFNQSALSTVEEYDPTTDIWIQKEDMPTGRWLLSASVVNGIIYAIGGSPYASVNSEVLSTVEAYDPTTNTWTTKTNMPTKRWYLSTCAVGGKIYAIGGGKSDPITALSVVEEYDPATDSWTTKASMPTPRWGLATSVVNGKIYAIGGEYAAEQACSTVEEYDPATDTWTPKANISGKRTHFSSSVVNGIIYAIGGASAPGSCLSRVEMYNPDIDTWTTMTDMPTPRYGLSTSTVNNRIYAIGGEPGGTIGLSNVEEYNPHLDLLPLIDKIEVDKSYVKPGNDNVCITTKISDPTGITLMAKIEAPDQTPVDSLELFDDGKHGDGNAGDGLYANIWPVNSAEERNYYVDLKVKRVDTDTVIHHISNMAAFTTIGPVTVENYTFTGDDKIPEPGDKIYLEITLCNNGSTTTATNVTARLISLDPLVTISGTSRSFGNIAAGENAISSSIYTLTIDEEWTGNTSISILAKISSNDYPYWKDTFYIPGQQVNIEEIREPITRIYPNPTDNILNIEISNASNQGIEIEILDITGKVIYQKKYNKANAHFTEQIDLSSFTKGIYLIKVKQADIVYAGKIVVR